MRRPQIKLRISTLMTVVLILALVAALCLLSVKTDRRVAELQAELQWVRSLVPEPYTGASGGMNQTSIHAVGDHVLIAAVADIMDRRANAEYVWSVEMFDAHSRSSVFLRRYDKRIIRPYRGLRSPLAFTDIIQPSLPAGDYRVLVSLSFIPPEKGVAGLDDKDVAPGSIVVSGSGNVTIEENKQSD